VVHRQTQQTAQLYGLNDRGAIAVGKRADINIIDFEKLNFMMPEMVYDLPAQGRRLIQHAKGYDATFVAGIQTVDFDKFTGRFPGNLCADRVKNGTVCTWPDGDTYLQSLLVLLGQSLQLCLVVTLLH